MMYMRLLFVCLVLSGLNACQDSVQSNKNDRYPWQVNIMTDGSSQIFGVHLGVTTVAEVRQTIGNAPRIALFENPNGRLSLELFYKEFTRAGLSGKLILTAGVDGGQLQSLKQQSQKKEKLESGVIQHFLNKDSLASIDALPVTAMTYMPYANLDEDVVRARFGEPAEKIRSHEQAQHWLYPAMGLDLIINEAGKEVLQYVAPKEFEKLAKPLRK